MYSQAELGNEKKSVVTKHLKASTAMCWLLGVLGWLVFWLVGPLIKVTVAPRAASSSANKRRCFILQVL